MYYLAWLLWHVLILLPARLFRAIFRRIRRDVQEVSRTVTPHDDPFRVHEPLSCESCDAYPRLQLSYLRWGKPFSSERTSLVSLRSVNNPFTLRRMQDEQRQWAAYNFGSDIDPLLPFVGAVEEIGELAHALLKERQGIRGTSEEHRQKQIDAICDATVYLSDLCTRLGFDYQDELERVWGEVRERDWVQYPDTGLPPRG